MSEHPAGTILDRTVRRGVADLLRTCGARRVGLALVEGGGRRLRFTASERTYGAAPDESALEWCHIDAYDDVPLTSVVRTGAALMGDLDELHDQFPGLVEHQRTVGTVAIAALPLTAGGTPIGGVVLFYDRAQAFDPSQCHALLAGTGALAAELRAAQAAAPRRAAASEETPAVAAEADRADQRSAHTSVDADPRSVALARRFVRQHLAAWQVAPDVVDTAVLCVSELVTNVVMHVATGSEVDARLDGTLLTVSVRDHGAERSAGAPPELVAPDHDPLEVHGRGLRLVEALTSRWGSELDADGTTVWFMLDTA